MKVYRLVFFCFFLTHLFGQEVNIQGIAPQYIGQRVRVYLIEDYLTMKDSLAAQTTVNKDSTFSLNFTVNETRKVVFKIGNNHSFLYVQPQGTYLLYVPLRDPYTPYRPAGNHVELTFLDLDSNDINFKILGFNGWFDNYAFINFQENRANPTEFTKRMNDFKDVAQQRYMQDTGTFFFNYVRFSIANFDNIQQRDNKNRYEKHDFYLKFQPVLYQNDAYMDYFKSFYKNILASTPIETSNRIYLGLLKNSPSLMMNAMGKEYTLINTRIRELTLIQLLSELYYDSEYPQENILEVLDSLKENALFEAHKNIAKNTLLRLKEAQDGGKAPDFVIQTQNGQKKLNDYKEKYLYIHFFDPKSEKSLIEMPILIKLYDIYRPYINFVSICKESSINEESQKRVNELKWDYAVIPDNDMSIWTNYKVGTFPSYVLIDPYSYIVQAPALGPQPSNTYQTIHEVFAEIKELFKPVKKE